MKNLNNRTKRLLAIAGVVIVVVVAGLVLLGPGEAGLFGASDLVITPSNPTWALGGVYPMSVSGASFSCNWFTSNSAVATFVAVSDTRTKVVQVLAKGVGSATIEARCGAFLLNHVSTTVTVYRPY